MVRGFRMVLRSNRVYDLGCRVQGFRSRTEAGFSVMAV